ncbi:hypothetical protein M8C17_21750 [Micromonospora sp. RHAY321]|uniref:hypothetical protein n=1 Tax=Micromonospora sp. RHAY321 TaxID=2944807 RepID=UPI00207CDCBD|nr:hypothetical protein [Micromonospora sp. RHAY321]MCO1597780.1 hypothetical protein [Micromonospora sp. RHAY321]
MSVRRGVAVLGVVVTLLAGCRSARDESSPEPVRPQWQASDLPAPPGAPGRLVVRDAAACAGRWYVVGAVAGPDGSTRPAAWRSTDGRSWSPLPLHPISYYGERAILYAVGCHEGRVAVIGARAGGAHGNPRVRTWRQDADGGLTEVPAEFELYGGPDAVSASRIAGGGDGWLIAGARTGGASVWHSPDAADFQLVDQAPALASEPALTTLATDALAAADGWLVSGAGRPAGRADRDPFVWFSEDARAWTRVALPATGEDEVVQRLLRVGSVVYALGVRGSVFQAWARETGAAGAGAATTAGEWRAVGRFGATGTGAVAGVEAVAGGGGELLAMTVGARDHQLWRSADGGTTWASVTLPIDVSAGGDTSATVAVLDGRMMIAIDGGTAAALWSASLPTT